ncbi:MAG: hypothetical protein CMJ46_05320 [Planctomyces sp.]|nr:hypothetical protein [Planctomyces sp.]
MSKLPFRLLSAGLLSAFCLTATFTASLPLSAAEETEDKSKLAYTDTESAPEDFKFQGEYAGKIKTDEGEVKVGVHVISRGDGKFDAVGYVGGLPGDGWTQEERLKSTGKLKEGEVRLSNYESDLIGIVKDDQIAIVTDRGDGQTIGTLEKVHRESPTLGAEAPEGAIVLFDGTSGEKFENGQVTESGLLMQGVTSKEKFKSCTLHVEFMLPYMPYAVGQQRGNSGCYLQGRYEVQMLDSFGLAGLDNECGAIYSVKSPRVNMCYPPLTWQTYDIDFEAAVYDEEGNKTKPAYLTVRHNGVLVQDKTKVESITRAAPVQESPEPGPLYLQDHSNPVRYRNIWLVEK